MTVEELIAKLETLPKDLPVDMYTYDDYQDEPVAWFEVTSVTLSENKARVQIEYGNVDYDYSDDDGPVI